MEKKLPWCGVCAILCFYEVGYVALLVPLVTVFF